MTRIQLRSLRAQLLGWSLGGMAYFLMIGALFGLLIVDAYEDVWENFPPELRDAFGTESITTVEGFMRVEAAAWLGLALGILPVLLAIRGLTGAEERGLLDHLLARPITRSSYFRGHVQATLILLLTLVAASAAGGFIGLLLGGVAPSDAAKGVGVIVDLVPLGLFFTSLGALLGAVFHRRGPAAGIGVAFAAVSFATDIVARVARELDYLAWFTPYGYLGRTNLADGHVDVAYWILVPTLSVGILVLGWRRFEEKDIRA